MQHNSIIHPATQDHRKQRISHRQDLGHAGNEIRVHGLKYHLESHPIRPPKKRFQSPSSNACQLKIVGLQPFYEPVKFLDLRLSGQIPKTNDGFHDSKIARVQFGPYGQTVRHARRI
jgi:hypothetical protein